MPAHRPDEDHAAQSELERDEEQAADFVERFMPRVAGLRSWFYRRPGAARIWRIGIALVGLVVIIVGVALLVLPGPGWVVIFVGLGIWATEFSWAQSLLRSVQRTLGKWLAWIQRHPRRLFVAGGVGLIIVAAVAAGVWFLTV